jgi:hypothetical protein
LSRTAFHVARGGAIQNSDNASGTRAPYDLDRDRSRREHTHSPPQDAHSDRRQYSAPFDELRVTEVPRHPSTGSGRPTADSHFGRHIENVTLSSSKGERFGQLPVEAHDRVLRCVHLREERRCAQEFVSTVRPIDLFLGRQTQTASCSVWRIAHY